MADKLTVNIVTPTRKVAAGEADMVVLPASEGEMGVLPGHDMYMVLLGTGTLRLTNNAQTTSMFVAKGYAEIDSDQVIVLAEVCERPDEIDPDRAAAAQKRAEERLAKSHADPEIDINRAQAALMRALHRQALKKGGTVH
ncbi:MAG: F0F1 ATP synthase subunit epsilon [Deltaproteobacteria bacterium]|nr:F0F1 ATP synthase subunit epsilon [Deltaproteobacteria bacterium]